MNYELIKKQISSFISPAEKQISILANTCAILKEELSHFWVGFYIVDEDKSEMYLGPFQGPLACTKIPFGKGVCGSSWKERKTYIVPNVHEFDGHIACSSETNSEIVVPVLKNKKVVAVLDIDSKDLDSFSREDALFLEEVCELLSKIF